MKTNLIRLAVLVSMLVTTAWTQTNTFPSSGNVGIGTTNPESLLEVDGAIATKAGPGFVAFAMYGDIAGAHWLTSAGNYSLNFYNDNSTGATGFNNNISADSETFYNKVSFTPNGGAIFGGSVGIGTTSPAYTLDVAGAIHAAGAINASSGITFPDGTSQTTAFNSTLCGGDYAESVFVTGKRISYEPGDVLVIDPNSPGKFLKSKTPYASSVAGIFSTKPGTVGRRQATAKSPDEIPMAMVGIVPVKVTTESGPIRPGDLLVTASTAGYAMKGTDRNRMLGAVIGKALNNLDSGKGVIEVLVTLQ